MKASPEIESQGLRAYERAHAYQALRPWRLPATYVACIMVPVACGFIFWGMGHPYWAFSQILFAIFFTGSAQFHWHKLAAEYKENLKLLADLENSYGADLPWIKMEKHFQTLREIEAEMARAKTD